MEVLKKRTGPSASGGTTKSGTAHSPVVHETNNLDNVDTGSGAKRQFRSGSHSKSVGPVMVAKISETELIGLVIGNLRHSLQGTYPYSQKLLGTCPNQGQMGKHR